MEKAIAMTNRQGMFKNLCLFIAPLMLTGILQLLYTASDLIICGMFGPEHSTGAISETSPLIGLIVNTFLGLAVGVNVLMARCFGANDQAKGQRVVYTAVAIAVILGVVVGVFGALCSHYFLTWIKTPADVLALSTQYLAIYFIGVPFTMIYNFAASILRAMGDTRKPFYFLTISGVINVLLNLLFVIVFDLGVAGVAICTAISQFCAAAMVILYLMHKQHGFFHFKIREIRIYKRELLEITKIGLPAGLQSFIFSFSNLMIMSSINSLGTAVLDGNGAASSLESFVYTPINSCAQGALTFASANYGAKNKPNIVRAMLYAMGLMLMVWAVFSGIILLFASPLLQLYISASASINAAWQRMLVILSTYFLCGVMDIFAYGLRAIGYSTLPTIISAIGVCGFRLFWVFAIFPIPYFNNLLWLALSYPISWLLSSLILLTCFIILFKRLRFKDEPAAPDEDTAVAA